MVVLWTVDYKRAGVEAGIGVMTTVRSDVAKIQRAAVDMERRGENRVDGIC